MRAFIRSVKKQDFGLSSGKPAHPRAAAKRTTLNPLISSLRIRWSEAPCRAPFDCRKETFQVAAQRASLHAFFCSLKKAIFRPETAKKAFKRRAPSCPKRKNDPPSAKLRRTGRNPMHLSVDDAYSSSMDSTPSPSSSSPSSCSSSTEMLPALKSSRMRFSIASNTSGCSFR